MAGVLDLPTLIQRVRLDTDSDQAERDAQSAVSRIGTSMSRVGLGLTAGVSAPIAAFFASGVQGASDLAESASKVGVVFEDQADQVRAFAETAATQLGISEQAALEATGTFGNLFRALGTGTADAAAMSTELVTLASDLASFNNASPEDVLLALRSGLLGEAEPLRQFGVSLSEARIQAEALASGIAQPIAAAEEVTTATLAVERAVEAQARAIQAHGRDSLEARTAADNLARAEANLAEKTAGVVPELTAAQKAQAAYQVIMDDTALAQGDFSRTSDGLANQQRILAAQFQDTKASLGEALLPVVQRAVGFVNDLLGAFRGLSPEAQRMVEIGLGLAAALGPVLLIAGRLASSFSAIRGVMGGASLLGFGPLLPVIVAVGAAAYVIYRNWDRVAPVFERVRDVAVLAFNAFRGAFEEGDVTSNGFIGTVERVAVTLRNVIGQIGAFWRTLTTGFTEDEGTPVERFALLLRNDVLPIVQTVFRFIQRNARPIMVGLAAAFAVVTAPVASVVAALVLAYQRFEGFRNVVNGVVRFLIGTVVPIVADFATQVGTKIGELIAYFQRIAPQVQEAFGHVVSVVQTVLGVVRSIIETALGAVAALWRAWGDDIFRIVSAIWEAIQEVINAALDIVRGIIQTVLALINGDWGELWDGILTILRGAWDAIYGVIDGAVGILRGLLGGIFSTFQEILRPIGNWLHTWIVTPFEDILSFIGGLPGRIRTLASGMWDGIWDAFRGVINLVIRGWNSLEFEIPGFDPPGPGPTFGGFTLGLPQIDELALGGRSTPGRPFIAGERGPELVTGFRGSAQVFNADRTERLLAALAAGAGGGGGGGLTLQVDARSEERRSGEQLGRDIAWGLSSASGGTLIGAGGAG